MYHTITRQCLLFLLLNLLSLAAFAQDTLRVNNVEAILYSGKGNSQPLLVGLGGSEGGNAWTSVHWQKTRNMFLERGYAFLAIGYFGCKGTPKILDRIAIDDVYNAIAVAKKQKNINSNKIALIGGSRGADLALLLGSYYKDITVVVGMSSSHAVFPGHTQLFNSSCWTYEGKELPFIPVNDEAVPFLIKRDLRGTFETMLKDTAAEQQAMIKVEKINGPVLLLSATKDEMIPAIKMGEKMMQRLKKSNFKYPYEHLILEGTHDEPMKHFDKIFSFLEINFK
jgi:acetyl esterase/lipase